MAALPYVAKRARAVGRSACFGSSRDREGDLQIAGRAWQEDGTLSARYWSEAAKERRDPHSVLYFYKGERPRHPNAPQLEGTGEFRLEDIDRASGYWITRSDADPQLRERTARVLSARRSSRHGVSTAATLRHVPNCSPCAFASGGRSRTPSDGHGSTGTCAKCSEREGRRPIQANGRPSGSSAPMGRSSCSTPSG